jgi:hypothetical protein
MVDFFLFKIVKVTAWLWPYIGMKTLYKLIQLATSKLLLNSSALKLPCFTSLIFTDHSAIAQLSEVSTQSIATG